MSVLSERGGGGVQFRRADRIRFIFYESGPRGIRRLSDVLWRGGDRRRRDVDFVEIETSISRFGSIDRPTKAHCRALPCRA